MMGHFPRHRRTRIEIHVFTPDRCEPIAIEFDPREFDMSPLPRDRELAWCGDSHRQARMQEEHRREMADHVARLLAAQIRDSILEAIRSRDPVNGYSPEENAQMDRIRNEFAQIKRKNDGA